MLIAIIPMPKISGIITNNALELRLASLNLLAVKDMYGIIVSTKNAI